MSLIYDAFLFYNELDLLEIRLNELNDVVDYFVLVEGEKTFQNNPKSLIYQENKEKFKEFEHKIIHIVKPIDSFTNNAWANEDNSFDLLGSAVINHSTSDDNLVILGCVDEIPSAYAVSKLKALPYNGDPVVIKMDFFCYYLNTQFICPTVDFRAGPLIAVRELRTAQASTFIKPRCRGRYTSNTLSSNLIPVEHPHGWHFTFMGDADRLYDKIHGFSHTEYNWTTHESLEKARNNLSDPFNRPREIQFYKKYPIENLPLYVQTNMEKFNYLIKHD